MDAAFKSAPFPAMTAAQLVASVARIEAEGDRGNIVSLMRAEIERRAEVKAGNWEVMTPAERLRVIRAQALA